MRAISTEATVTQKGEFFLPDSLSCQDTWQHQVQDRYPVIETTGRHTQKRYLPQVGHKKHGAGTGSGAVMELSGSGQTDSMAGYIVRIHTHPSAQQKQITTPIQMGTYHHPGLFFPCDASSGQVTSRACLK